MATLSRIEELFHFAVQNPSTAESVLQSECADDDSLLQSVLELLRVHSEDAEMIFDRPLVQVSEFSLAAELDWRLSEDDDCRLQPGDVLLNYQIVRQLGEGGMATAFLAKELHPIQRLVAIKVLKSGFYDSQAVHRFAVERQVLAALRHPAIPTILNAGITGNGFAFLALEFIDGVAISSYCQKHNANATERIRLFAELCRIVGYVHDCGFIHRDIKSANVLVAASGGVARVHLIDFGIARVDSDAIDSLKGDTGTGQILGTPNCMSPEQFLPGLAPVDHRSDIYSLGLLLYRLLTDSTPLEQTSEDSASKLAALQHPVPPSAVATLDIHPQTARQIDSIALKCLQVSVDQRYQATSELVRDLECILNSASIPACQPSTLGMRPVKQLVSMMACAAMFLFLPASDMPVSSPATETLVGQNDVVQTKASADIVQVDSATFDHISRILNDKGISAPATEGRLQIHAVAESDSPNDQQVVTLMPDFVPADAI